MFDPIVIISLLFMAALCMLFLNSRKLLDGFPRFSICLMLTVLAFVIRWAVIDYETLDYKDFLTHWVSFFRENGGFKALARPVGNYNIPYLYFLAFFSYLNVRDLYLIKLLSIFFDIILACSSMLMVSRFTQSKNRLTACFFTVLFLPTVFLNGSLWAQCDSIYVALAVLSIYLALEDRPVLSMLCITLSFGFKLQAVFVMPVFAVLWFMRKIKFRHFFIFPIAYTALVMPAVIAGRPFMDCITLYFNQTGSIGSGLNYNSPSIYAIFYNVQSPEFASRLGIIAAFVFMLTVLAVCFIFRQRLSDKAVLAAAMLFVLGIPFLLPHMHDRYFFACDIISIVLAFSFPWFSIVAPLAQFASILGYHAYLKMRWLLTMNYGAAALIVALALAIIFFIWSLISEKENSLKFPLDNS